MKYIILLLLPFITTAQNLVKNGNFEETPINNINIVVDKNNVGSNEPITDFRYDESIDYLQDWKLITNFDRYFGHYYDYRVEKAISQYKTCKELVKPIKNVCARSTDFHHINVFYTQLATPTDINKEYILNLDYLISGSDTKFLDKFKNGNFSIIFSNTRYNKNTISVLDTNALVITINTDSCKLKEWNNTSKNIKFDKAYAYMYVGNTKPFSRPIFYKTDKNYCGGIGYYIDNISLVPVEEIYTYKINSLKKGDIITLDNINFSVNSDSLSLDSYPTLNSFIKYLNSNNFTIEISGHTDNTGNFEKNMKLSENRAKAVYNYFINKGVLLERLSFVGYGSTKPIESNDTEEGKNKNRRVEIRIQ